MKQLQRISVFGLGKLGGCIAATLAARGFDVLGVDIGPEKVRAINEGKPPVQEPLLAETITAGHGRLRATTDHREAVQTDASCFIPPSPSLPDGSFSSEFLLKAMQPIAKACRVAGKKGGFGRGSRGGGSQSGLPKPGVRRRSTATRRRPHSTEVDVVASDQPQQLHNDHCDPF